jgi:hypothetical protein
LRIYIKLEIITTNNNEMITCSESGVVQSKGETAGDPAPPDLLDWSRGEKMLVRTPPGDGGLGGVAVVRNPSKVIEDLQRAIM